MEIIKATREDFEDVFKIDNQVENFHIENNPEYLQKVEKEEKFKYWKNMMKDENSFILLAKINNNPVGYVIIASKVRSPMFKINKWLTVDAIGVDKDHQGQNIGQELCKYVENYAKDNGYAAIYLNVWDFNKGAQNFYKKQGFRFQSHNMEKIF